MWARKSLWPALLLLQSALALPSKETIVYPHLLESRAANGDRMLKVSDDLTLTLEHKPAYDGHLLVVTSREDGTLLHRHVPASDFNKDLFQDREHMASLMVSHDDGALHVNGIIGEELRIKPAPEMERSSEGHVPHLLYRQEPSNLQSRFTDYLSLPVAESGVEGGNTDPVVVTELVHVLDGSKETTTSTAPVNNSQHSDYLEIPAENTSSGDIPSTVAASVHEDYLEIPTDASGSVNESWTTAGAASTGQPEIVERAYGSVISEVHLVIDMKYLKAFGGSQDKVIKYFGVVRNSVALRYETITLLNVRLKIVGFTFNTRADMEPYLKPFHGHAEYIGDDETLAEFNEYMKLKHAQLYAKVDLIFLITGRTMAFVENGTINSFVQGLAFVGGVCTKYRVGMAEDVPWSFDVVRVLSHEAAHSLGCVHDGEGPDRGLLREGPHPGAKTCPWDAGFIMSYVRKNNNEFRFSSCCERQMLFLSRLKSRSCILAENSADVLASQPKRLPGSDVSLDDICKKAFGETFLYDTTHSLKGCKIKCTTKQKVVVIDGEKFLSRDTGETSSMEGSPCDSDDSTKVCIRGECVSRKDFPYDSKVLPAVSITKTPPHSRSTTRRPTTKFVWYTRRRGYY